MKNRFEQLSHKIALGIAAVFVVSNLSSCNDIGGIDSQDDQPPRFGLTAQQSYAVTSAGAREIKFTVSSNTPWSIASDKTWCVPTPVNSTVSALVQEVTVNVEDNTTLESRTAMLTITGEGAAKQEVTIVQDAKSQLDVTMFEVDVAFSGAGESREFTVLSNKDCTVSSDKTWLTLDVTEIKGSNQPVVVTATAQANDANIRRATIMVTNGLDKKQYVVAQSGNQLEVLNADESEFDHPGGTRKFSVSANIDWVAEPAKGSEWIEIVAGKSGSGNGEFEIKLLPNAIFTQRRGEVLIKPKFPIAGLEPAVVKVTQKVSFRAESSKGITYNEQGGLIFTSVDGTGTAKMVTNSKIRMGTFIWKFSSIDIPEGSNPCFDINGDQEGSPSSANFRIYLRNSPNARMQMAGGFSWWSNENLFNGGQRLENLKTFKMEILPNPTRPEKLIFRFYFNDALLTETTDRTNVYTNSNEKGQPLYFGITSASGTFVLDSFTMIPYQE